MCSKSHLPFLSRPTGGPFPGVEGKTIKSICLMELMADTLTIIAPVREGREPKPNIKHPRLLPPWQS